MRIGSLFSGYGGLDMAVQNVFGGELAWYSEIDKHACTVLAAHHPGVPNLGDITTVDWATVPPVDILTGGYPCQPFSQAGQRKGTNDERHLWPYVRDAIRVIRPRLTVLENVRGHLTLGFDTVLADLADLGMSARWGVVRASDAGAPHGRARVFIAVFKDAAGVGPQASLRTAGEVPHEGIGLGSVRPVGPGGSSFADADSGRPWLELRARRVGSMEGHSEAGTREWEWSRRVADSGGNSPTSDSKHYGRDGSTLGRGAGTDAATWRMPQLEGRHSEVDWNRYEPAIRRWERVTGRPAPAPTVPGAVKKERLSTQFVEWMMGLPAGHVTGHGLSHTSELKMLGNGVVPQQAELALRMLLDEQVAA